MGHMAWRIQPIHAPTPREAAAGMAIMGCGTMAVVLVFSGFPKESAI
jgi:hypothetical protein